MKLDIYIKQNKSETSIVVEIDKIKQLSMRKIIGTSPDDVVKTLSSIIIDVTIRHTIHYINIYCAQKGLYLFLTKKDKGTNLAYLYSLLELHDYIIFNRKFSEIKYKFNDYIVYIGSYKNESAILKETLGNTVLYHKQSLLSKETYTHIDFARLLQQFLQKEKKSLKRVTTDIYFMIDDNYVCDRLNQLLLSDLNSDDKKLSDTIDIAQILMECACTIKELQAHIIFVPKYQNKACRYCKEGVHV